MTSENYMIIRGAIEHKQQLFFDYDGFHREVCPHIIGWNDQGQEQLLGYQFAGESSKGQIPTEIPASWRCFKIAKMSRLVVRDGQWYTDEQCQHKREQQCVAHVDLDVSKI